jgi:hypothetical protein
MQTDLPPNILEVLDGMAFPATVIEIVSYAEDHDASEDVLDLIQAMPDRDYASLAEVSRHLGLIEELPGQENLWSSAPPEDTPQPGDPAPFAADIGKAL